MGQSVEIIYFLRNCASNKTFGKPSNFDVKTNTSQLLIKLYGLDLYPNNFTSKLLMLINFFKFLYSFPLPIIVISYLKFDLINFAAFKSVK